MSIIPFYLCSGYSITENNLYNTPNFTLPLSLRVDRTWEAASHLIQLSLLLLPTQNGKTGKFLSCFSKILQVKYKNMSLGTMAAPEDPSADYIPLIHEAIKLYTFSIHQKEDSPNQPTRLLNHRQEWLRQRSLFPFFSRALKTGNQTGKLTPSSALPFTYYSVSYFILPTEMASPRAPQHSSTR